MRKCFKILETLKKSNNSWPFLEPVDPIKLKIPDYFEIVKEPMDLTSIETSLLNGTYRNPAQFEHDVRKIWSNSILYNPQYSQIYQITLKIRDEFDELFRNRDKKDLDQQIDKKIKKLVVNLKRLPDQVTQYYQKQEQWNQQLQVRWNEKTPIPAPPTETNRRNQVPDWLNNIPSHKLEHLLKLATAYDTSNIIN